MEKPKTSGINEEASGRASERKRTKESRGLIPSDKVSLLFHRWHSYFLFPATTMLIECMCSSIDV